MFHLFLEKGFLPAFEGETEEAVIKDYIQFRADGIISKSIDRIEEVDENLVIKKIIDGDDYQFEIEGRIEKKQEEGKENLRLAEEEKQHKAQIKSNYYSSR